MAELRRIRVVTNGRRLRIGGIAGTNTFLGNTDTPSTFAGQSGKFAAVKSAEDGLEFSSAGAGDMLAAQNLSDVASQQTSLDNLTAVSAATDEHVLTKDTATGNAIFKAAAGGGGSGDVTGPVTSTDNAIATFDSTTGKIIQQNHTDVTIDDSDNLAGVNQITAGGNITLTAGILSRLVAAAAQDLWVSAASGQEMCLSMGDALGVNKVSFRDNAGTEQAAVDSDGNITTNGTVDGRDLVTDGTKLDGIESAATADQSNAEIRTAVEAATDSNVFTDADHSKLDGIEAAATADQTAADIRTLGFFDITNDGTGSGLDADTVDGNEATAFATAAQGATADAALPLAGGTMTGKLQFSGTTYASIQLLSLTTTERNALTPAEGDVIYNETDSQIQGYMGAAWVNLGGAGGGLSNWEESGTTLQPTVAGYDLGAAGNEVGDLILSGDLNIDGATLGGSGTGANNGLILTAEGAGTLALNSSFGKLLEIGSTGAGIGFAQAAGGSGLTIGHAGSAGTNLLEILGGTSTKSGGHVLLRMEQDAGQTANSLEIDSNGGSGGDLFVVDDGGEVGIGNASPGAILHVDSNAANTVSVLRLENTAGDIDVFLTDATPEGAVTGSIGDLAIDRANGVIYLKETGSATNTGWVDNKGGAAGGDPDQNLWHTITGDSGTSPVPDGVTDTLTVAGGTGVDTAGDSGTDTLTVNLNAASIASLALADSALQDNDTLTTGLTFPNLGLKIQDNATGDFSLVLASGEDITGADKSLTLILGDANRILTLSGNPTLGDWFDQSVKSGDAPTFTGTNFTGIPTAGLVDEAVTYAKMQHVSATDKLLGRSTAGAGDVEEIACTAAGRALLDDVDAAAQRTTLGAGAIQRYRTFYIDAGAMVPDVTTGATASASPAEIATLGFSHDYMAFAGGAVEIAAVKFAMPDDWDVTAIKLKFFWEPASGASENDTVHWEARATAITDDDDISAATWTSLVNANDAVSAGTLGDMHVSPASGSLTVTGAALGDIILLEFQRDGVSDNMTEDAWLWGVQIQYQTLTTEPAAW